MPDHYHLICHKLVNAKHFAVEFVVRDGYEDVERKINFEMGYDVSISSCQDRAHLGPEPPLRSAEK